MRSRGSSGGVLRPPALGVAFAGRGSRAVTDADPAAALTEREREVLSLLAIGHMDPEIAALLYLSPRTGRIASRDIQRKLGVRSRADLVRAAAEIEERESRTGKEGGRSHPGPP